LACLQVYPSRAERGRHAHGDAIQRWRLQRQLQERRLEHLQRQLQPKLQCQLQERDS